MNKLMDVGSCYLPHSGVKGLSHLRWAAIAAIALGMPPIVLRAFASLRRWLLDINVLMIIAVAGAVPNVLCRRFVCIIGAIHPVNVYGAPRRHKTLSNPSPGCPDMLMREGLTVGATGAIAIGDYTEGAAVVVLFGLAEWLEVRSLGVWLTC